MAWELDNLTNPFGYKKGAQKPVNNMSGLLDFALQANQFAPVTGDIQSGILAANDLSQGNYGSAALNAVGLLPFIPSIGGTIKNSNVLNDVISPYKKQGLIIDAYLSKNKPEITVSKIQVPKDMRNKGIGTSAMQDIIDYANKTKNAVSLSPSTDFGASSVGRLKNFYKKLGFVENKGRNKDFTISETMYYKPKE